MELGASPESSVIDIDFVNRHVPGEYMTSGDERGRKSRDSTQVVAAATLARGVAESSTPLLAGYQAMGMHVKLISVHSAMQYRMAHCGILQVTGVVSRRTASAVTWGEMASS
jgi:hypothetical protein